MVGGALAGGAVVVGPPGAVVVVDVVVDDVVVVVAAAVAMPTVLSAIAIASAPRLRTARPNRGALGSTCRRATPLHRQTGPRNGAVIRGIRAF